MNAFTITGATMAYVEPNTAWKILGPWEYGQVTGILGLSAPADELK